MSKYLTIIFNDEKVLEYDRNIRLPGKKRQFLDMMDMDMDEGINIRGDIVEYPSQKEKVKYVAMNLINAMFKKDEALVQITCAYLSHRVPDLKQVIANECENNVYMELVYD